MDPNGTDIGPYSPSASYLHTEAWAPSPGRTRSSRHTRRDRSQLPPSHLDQLGGGPPHLHSWGTGRSWGLGAGRSSPALGGVKLLPFLLLTLQPRYESLPHQLPLVTPPPGPGAGLRAEDGAGGGEVIL